LLLLLKYGGLKNRLCLPVLGANQVQKIACELEKFYKANFWSVYFFWGGGALLNIFFQVIFPTFFSTAYLNFSSEKVINEYIQ